MDASRHRWVRGAVLALVAAGLGVLGAAAQTEPLPQAPPGAPLSLGRDGPAAQAPARTEPAAPARPAARPKPTPAVAPAAVKPTMPAPPAPVAPAPVKPASSAPQPAPATPSGPASATSAPAAPASSARPPSVSDLWAEPEGNWRAPTAHPGMSLPASPKPAPPQPAERPAARQESAPTAPAPAAAPRRQPPRPASATTGVQTGIPGDDQPTQFAITPLPRGLDPNSPQRQEIEQRQEAEIKQIIDGGVCVGCQ